MQFEENEFILSPLETKEVNVYATAKEGSDKQVYEGAVKVYSMNP